MHLAWAIGAKLRIAYINQFAPTDAWVILDTVTLTYTLQSYFDLTMWRQPPRLYRLVPVPSPNRTGTITYVAGYPRVHTVRASSGPAAISRVSSTRLSSGPAPE